MASPLAYRSMMLPGPPRMKSSSRNGLHTPKYWEGSFVTTPIVMSLKNLPASTRTTTVSLAKSPSVSSIFERSAKPRVNQVLHQTRENFAGSMAHFKFLDSQLDALRAEKDNLNLAFKEAKLNLGSISCQLLSFNFAQELQKALKVSGDPLNMHILSLFLAELRKTMKPDESGRLTLQSVSKHPHTHEDTIKEQLKRKITKCDQARKQLGFFKTIELWTQTKTLYNEAKREIKRVNTRVKDLQTQREQQLKRVVTLDREKRRLSSLNRRRRERDESSSCDTERAQEKSPPKVKIKDLIMKSKLPCLDYDDDDDFVNFDEALKPQPDSKVTSVDLTVYRLETHQPEKEAGLVSGFAQRRNTTYDN